MTSFEEHFRTSLLENTLKPDVLISPTIVGTGDSLTIVITTREMRMTPGGSNVGTRVSSVKIGADNPQASLAGVVSGVMNQVDELLRQPIYVRFQRPPSSPRPARRAP
ncbi:MAG: hypothetical protein ABIS03_14025 [Gemmatimonadaceae bacterium]